MLLFIYRNLLPWLIGARSLNEIVSEKLRAAALRETVAPRDFYDLDFVLRNNFDLADKEVMSLFRKRLRKTEVILSSGSIVLIWAS